MTAYLLSAILLTSFRSLAVETAITDGQVAVQAETLPLCIDDKDKVDAIAARVKLNTKTKAKYDGYREALSSDSDLELVARLAYAETLAANCASMNMKIAPQIVQVIANRVRLRGDDVKSVVFQRDQFASSLNIYSSSRFKDFLCPKDPNLWNQVLTEAKSRLGKPSQVLTAKTVNYFLYKHDPRWTKEPWKLEEDRPEMTADVRECVRFFVVPGWK